QSHQRNEMDDLKRLYVDLPHGGKVPLTELATVDHTQGAARISRDDTRRRVVVGVNVRDRDLQSVVDEIQNLIDSTIELPVGYSITFGGQFENLQRAKERLLIAVPLALGLIFLMLYLAFKSLRKALIIYSAIPLAAVGGVVLLWIRGMPFSISAGVGFIALFGIAVLNGIVLMEHFKELQNKEFESMDALIKEGAKDRLRAVLLTALAAALGFLPMAVSTNAGAEVQRPLATVVIGGLITATLLTLVVLPVLYALFLEHKKSGLSGSNVKWGSVIVLSLLGGHAMAQDTTKSLEELESMALLNNAELKTAVAKAETARALVVGAYNFDKTQLYYSYDQNNLAMNNKPLNVFGIAQDFEFPTVYFARRKVNKAHYLRETSLLDIERKKIRARLRQLFYRYQVLRQKEAIYRELDSLYKHFSQRAHRRFELGETNYLEKVTAQSTWKKMQVALQRAEQHVKMARDSIGVLVQAKEPFEIEGKPPVKLLLSPVQFENLPEMTYLEKSITHKKAQVGLARQAFLPDVGFEYFQGTNSNLGDHLYGYQMGIKIPLLFSGQRARLRAAKQQQMATMAQSNLAQIQLQAKYQMLLSKLENHKKYLAYYETEGNKLAEEILKMAEIGFKNGEIDFFQYIQSIGNAQEIQLGYLDELHNYNKTIIEIEHLSFN
ncbi:MAG: efflux RND transporter permease subunit, partial [Flavobacteriaceae bacterium]